MLSSCEQIADLQSITTLIGKPDAVQVSSAMGFGFRCGFLGLLHMEIVQERLEREYDVDLIVTSPTVVYRCNLTQGETMIVQNPTLLPEAGVRESIEEPFCRCVSWLSLVSLKAKTIGLTAKPLEAREFLYTRAGRSDCAGETVCLDFNDALLKLSHERVSPQRKLSS